MPQNWVQDPTTKTPVLQGDDGLVLLKDASGTVHKVQPGNVARLLSDPSSTYQAAHPADLEAVRQANVWKQATLDQKVQAGADTLASSIADGVTVIPRLAGEGVALGAHALGYGDGVSPLEKLNGRNLLDYAKTGIDKALGTSQAATDQRGESDRTMAEGMPAVMRTALEVGGFMAGGALAGGMAEQVEIGAKAIGLSHEAAQALGKAAQAFTPEGAVKVAGRAGEALLGTPEIGPATAGASRLGRYLGGATEGAGIGLTGASNEAWVKHEDLTAEAITAQMGIGGILGAAPMAAFDALKAVPGATGELASKLFGRAKSPQSLLDGPATDEAVNGMARDVAGVEPPSGFAGKMKEALNWARDRVEAGQSLATGADEETLKKYGALHFDPEAIKGQDLWRFRDKINEAGTTDLSEALTELHDASRPIYDEVTNLELKKHNIEHLITGDPDQILRLAHDKIVEFGQTVHALDATTGRGETLYGEGKQIADLKAAYWDAIDRLDTAEGPADVAITLDGLKRRLQNVKVNAESSASRLTSGLEIGQAHARIKLADEAQERLRLLLEDNKTWGDFGDSQKAGNAKWNRMLSTDQYVHPRITEITGKYSTPDRFGQTQWEISPEKIGRYVDSMGTAKGSLLDGKLRDNIVARKELAQTLVDSYHLGTHGEALQKSIDAADRALKILDRLKETSGTANLIDEVMQAEAATKGSGITGHLMAQSIGSAVAGPIGGAVGGLASQVLSSPGTAIRQAIALRSLVQRMTSGIGRSIGEVITGGEEGLAAASEAAGRKGVAGVAKHVAEEAEDFEGVQKFAGENAKEHVKGAALQAGEAGEKKEEAREAGPSKRERVAGVAAAEAYESRDKKYTQATTRITALMQDPSGLADALAEHSHEIQHGNVQASMIQTGLTAITFLNSKIPSTLFGGSPMSPKQMASVSSGDKAKFLRYFDAVNKPLDVFKDIKRGTATPEQMETLKTVYPNLYATAQMAVMKATHNRKKSLPLQTRLALAELFDSPGSIEPTLDPGFMSRISTAFQAGQAGENQKNNPAPKPMKGNVADSMKSPSLDNLKV